MTRLLSKSHLQIASWFINCPGGRLPVCRIKNKFALNQAELVGGYRLVLPTDAICLWQFRYLSVFALSLHGLIYFLSLRELLFLLHCSQQHAAAMFGGSQLISALYKHDFYATFIFGDRYYIIKHLIVIINKSTIINFLNICYDPYGLFLLFQRANAIFVD